MTKDLPEGCTTEDRTCEACKRLLAKHFVFSSKELGFLWEQGLVLTVCGKTRSGGVYVWVDPKGLPEDPCDEEFMMEISC